MPRLEALAGLLIALGLGTLRRHTAQEQSMNRYRRIVPPAAAVAMILTTAAARWPAPPRSDLIVHEWGTFTSVAGSDGVLLPASNAKRKRCPRPSKRSTGCCRRSA
ncbi:MAG: hypothetical protein U0470_14605 [Anaerolineae bacterium]